MLACPIPEEAGDGETFEDYEKIIAVALKDAAANGIYGKEVTPFLLQRLSGVFLFFFSS